MARNASLQVGRLKSGRVTARDVAERAGVSRHAVSGCFTPGACVAEDKRQRIIATANELGYNSIPATVDAVLELLRDRLENPDRAGYASGY